MDAVALSASKAAANARAGFVIIHLLFMTAMLMQIKISPAGKTQGWPARRTELQMAMRRGNSFRESDLSNYQIRLCFFVIINK